MHADDERDPLDRWLSQQIQPLPPPPGTFELITRRSRRRKLRKLAVTVVSAAAVAAAVAIAVPVGLNLHLSPAPTNGNLSAAGASSPSPSATGEGTQSPTAAGHRTLRPTHPPSPSSSSPAATHPVTEPSGPVPTEFLPTSVTFDSPQTGWAIGQAGTAGQCVDNNPDFCTSIVRTDDAGRTWQGGPAPKTTGQDGPTGVSGIRFLNGVDGWAFGPELYATHDEGNTWTQVDTAGSRVTDLETSDGRAYALFATCTGTSNYSFAENCTSYTLMTATEDSDSWTPVGQATSGLANGGGATSAVLALTGTNGYLLAPDGTLYSGPIGGTWARVGTAPCRPGTVQASGLPANALLALVGSSQLAITCEGLTSTGPPPLYTSGPPSVYTSDNGGARWTQLPAAAWSGITDLSHFGFPTSLAAAPNGTLVLATNGGIYTLAADAERWQPSSATGTGAPDAGFTYVGMTTDEQGVALPASVNLHQIWMTFDGGATWAPATSILPGS
jgi:hypothetical protein